jgi:hypothetical protein
VNLVDGRQGRLIEVGESRDGVEALAVLNVASGAEAPGLATPGAAPLELLVPATELPLPYRLP